MPNLMHVIPRTGQNTIAPVLPPFRWVYDDFERPDTTAPDLSGGDVAWAAGDGWHITGGVAICDNTSLTNALADARHTDYVMNVGMRPNNAGVTTATAIVFRYLDPDNFAWIGRNRVSAGWRDQCNAIVAGTPTVLAATSIVTTQGARWEVTVTGNQVTATVNGTPVLGGTVTLPAELATGTRVGMRSSNGNGFGEYGVYSHTAATTAQAPALTGYGMPDDD